VLKAPFERKRTAIAVASVKKLLFSLNVTT
jgi:hypothetical protein